MNNKNENTLRSGCILFWIYFKCMLFAFTGGGAIIPLLKHEIVEKYKFMSDDEYVEIIALVQTLPGVISIHNANMTGHRVCGWFGSVMATLGTVLPAVTSMLLVGILFQNLTQNKIAMSAIRGIRAVSVATLLDTGIRIIKKLRKNTFNIVLIMIGLCLPLFSSLSSFWAILLCGSCGIIALFFRPASVAEKPHTSDSGASE